MLGRAPTAGYEGSLPSPSYPAHQRTVAIIVTRYLTLVGHEVIAMSRSVTGHEAIKTLHERCETSVEATAIRYVQNSREPVVVVRSRVGAVGE